MRFFTLDGQVVSGPSPYEIATPWAGADIDDLQFAQTADVCYVTHKSYLSQKLERHSETNWTIVPVPLQDGPYQDIVTDGSTITPSGTGNVVPTMTSNTTPSGVAAASEEHTVGPNGFAWNAFDGEPEYRMELHIPSKPDAAIYVRFSEDCYGMLYPGDKRNRLPLGCQL
jgi:hypothetical protein